VFPPKWELLAFVMQVNHYNCGSSFKAGPIDGARGIGGLTLLAWGYMIREAHGMSLSGVCCCAGLKMSGPDVSAWSPWALLALFLMWAEMMVAMMLPSAAPMILTFAMVNRKRRERDEPFTSTGIFVLAI